MKTVVFVLYMLLLWLNVAAQSKKYDSVAILIIDRMADVIGDLKSCSYKLSVINDVADPPYKQVKYFSDYEVYMSGPDKMLINAHGHKGHRQLMYNGAQLAYYSFDEHNYGLIPAPATIIETVDSIHARYGLEFPAADFFYPAFTDDLLEQSDSLLFLGKVNIDDREYFQVMSLGKEQNIQLWINNDAYNLPAKFAITYKNQAGNPQYIASFSDWQINPELPPAMFDFLPPPGAAKVRIMSKTER